MTLQIPLRALALSIGDRAADDRAVVELPTDAPDWFGRAPECPIRRPDDREPAPRVLICAVDATVPDSGAPILRSDLDDASLRFRLRHAIRRELDITLPGTLVRVDGVGVLISGAAGSGKSETALTLLDRGHTLVADDAVRIRAGTHDSLEGSAPDLLRGRLCVRGLGILDIGHQYPRQVASSTIIDLLVELRDSTAPGDGGDPLYGCWPNRGLLGESRPALSLSPQRPRALLIEQAARLQAARRSGHDPAAAFAAAQRKVMQCDS